MKLPPSFSRLYLLGMPGAGKSSVGRVLAARWGVDYADMDEEIEKEAGMKIPEIFRTDGESVFREIEKSVLMQLSSSFNGVIATGGGAPCFFDNMDLMNQTGITAFINTPLEQLEARLQQPTGRPMFDDEKSPGEKLRKLWAARAPFYLRSNLIIEESDDEKIIRRIENYFQSA